MKKRIDLSITNMLFALLLLQAICIRIFGLDYLSGDMEKFLLPWFDNIKHAGGFYALSTQIGDYNILYQTIIACLTYIDVNPIYLIKCVSICFDFILAFYIYLICKKILPFYVVLFIPTVVFNSAFWGQCDSMYTTFCVATLYYLKKERYACAFSALGLGFACKLQTIFILPFVCSYCFRRIKQINPIYYLFTLFSWWATGFFAYIFGRNIFAPFTIYVMQIGEWPRMFIDFPSFWAIFGQYGLNNYDILRLPAIVIAFSICLAGFIYYTRSGKFEDELSYYGVAACFVWSVILFLPEMHERYSYLLDILLIICAFKDQKFLLYPAITCFISLWCYLSGPLRWDVPHGVPLRAFTFFVSYILFVIEIIKYKNCNRAKS